jgi:hypothetical protein
MIMADDLSLFDASVKLPRKTVVICFAIVFLAMAVLSLLIPVFSRPDHSTAVVNDSRLYPFYYQTNPDAMLEMRTSLGFPWILKTFPVRVNRPVMDGLVTGVRQWIILPVLSVIIPKRAQHIMWGDFSAVSVLSTYCIWEFLNLVFTLAAAVIFFRTIRGFTGDMTALVASALVLTTPIVVLGMREIELSAFELFIIASSLWFWKSVIFDKMPMTRVTLWSLGFGILFLGKPAMSTFITGWVVAAACGRRKQALISAICLPLPTVAWLIALKLMHIPYQVTEVKDFGAGVWILTSASLFADGIHFAGEWVKILFETSGIVSLPFFLLGVWVSRKLTFGNKIPLVRISAAYAVVDFVFYFLVHRTHAIYGMHTMVLYHVFTAIGVGSAAVWLAKRPAQRPGQNARFSERTLAWVLLAAMQAVLLVMVLPNYGG